MPHAGPLVDDLRAARVETLVRPLAVLRRELLHPAGGARLLRALTADTRSLRRLIAERDVALVHSNTSAVLGGGAAARLAGVPHVWHVREIYTPFGRLWPPWREVLLSADALPCVSRATAAPLSRSPRSVGRVRVLYDGLALDATPAPHTKARAELELDGGAPVIAVLGRISDWKGQDVAIRALASPQLRERGAVLLLAGGAWPGAEERLTRVLELAETLGVRDRVALRGFRDDVSNVYGAADVVAVPSTAPDPLPNSALEASAAGCAVVASGHGGLPEIIRDGDTGRLVPPGDARALAATCAELIDAPDERERLGRAAARDVRARFAPEQLLSGIQDLWDEILTD